MEVNKIFMVLEKFSIEELIVLATKLRTDLDKIDKLIQQKKAHYEALLNDYNYAKAPTTATGYIPAKSPYSSCKECQHEGAPLCRCYPCCDPSR